MDLKKIVDIETVIDDGYNTIGYVAKGHVTAEEMQAGIDWAIGEGEVTVDPDRVKHVHLRKVPDATGEYAFFYWPSKPGRGAFKATEFYL